MESTLSARKPTSSARKPASSVRRLIQAFLKTCGNPSREADMFWRQEAAFADPHELGMCLRWGLARIVRIVGGQEVRGMLSFETYAEWRENEAGMLALCGICQ